MKIPIRSLVLSFAAAGCDVERDKGDDRAGDGESTTADGSTSGASTGEEPGGSEGSLGGSSGGSSGDEGTTAEVDDDACDELWAKDYCETEGGGEGVRFCGSVEGELRWGRCSRQIVCWPGDRKLCDFYTEYYEDCVLDEEGVPEWVEGEECGFTPLVLRFDDAERIELAYADGHGFDISGAGKCLTSDWPTAATPWLALDRDGNGVIDDARELFGSAVVLHGGDRARDGFAALAEFDADGDGKISAGDPVWSELLLWSDHDADRRSTGWELEPLAARGVTEIDLAMRVDRRCDERGNCEVERGRFTAMEGGRSVAGEVVDLHLVCQ